MALLGLLLEIPVSIPQIAFPSKASYVKSCKRGISLSGMVIPSAAKSFIIDLTLVLIIKTYNVTCEAIIAMRVRVNVTSTKV
jgi:hypothetical protein